MARKLPSLGRLLTTPALFAAAYGEIGSSLYFALGITAAYALSLTPLVFLAAGVIFALAAAAYAEGGATIAEPGGASAFARRAFNDLVGFIAGWATILDYLIVIALSALFVPHYLAGALGDVHRFSAHQATALAVLLLAVITAVRAVRRPDIYRLATILAILDLVVQVSLALLGLALLFSWRGLTHDVNVGTSPSWNSLAFALPIAMLAFTGLEKVASLAGLARDPAKTVPASLRTAVVTVIVVYAAVATAALSAFPSHRAPSAPGGYANGLSTTWANAPLLGLAHAIGDQTTPALGTALRVGIGTTAAVLLVLAIVTSFSGCARLAFAMGEHAQLPAIAARRSRRTLTAPVTIVSVGVLSAGFLVVAAMWQGQEALTLASLYSFGILIAFILTQASIIWLRLSEPDMPRPFMMRGNVRVRGRLVPVTSVVGLVLSFVSLVIALGTHPGARVVGPIWMLVGLGIYTVVRVRAGQPLLERVEPGAPPPAEITDVSYRTVVVPLERLDGLAEEIAATACRLAAESDATLVAVTSIVVPVRDPLDAPCPQREEEARRVQEMAASLADEYGVEFRPAVVRTRNAGRAIVDTALENDADLIVIGSPEKKRVARSLQEEFFGRTVDFVLRKAPCRVLVTHFPAEVEAREALAVS